MTDKNIAISVRNPGKRYILGGPQEKYLIPRDNFMNFCEGAVQAIASGSFCQSVSGAKRICNRRMIVY